MVDALEVLKGQGMTFFSGCVFPVLLTECRSLCMLRECHDIWKDSEVLILQTERNSFSSTIFFSFFFSILKDIYKVALALSPKGKTELNSTDQ